MVKFDVLKNLAKSITEEQEREIFKYGRYLVDVQREDINSRYRIVEREGHIYYHEMKDGNTIHCFEIAESWKPFKGVTIWTYTPDNFHIVEIDSRHIWEHDVKNEVGCAPFIGACFEYKGHTVFLMNENQIAIDGKAVDVKDDGEFIYKFLKKSILSKGGAKGVYTYVEHIAYSNKNPLYRHCVFSSPFDKLIELYGSN